MLHSAALPLFSVGTLQVLQGETTLELKETHMHIDTERNFALSKELLQAWFFVKILF